MPPQSPKTFEELSQCLLHAIGGPDALDGPFADVADVVLELEVEEYALKLAELNDNRVAPLLARVARWTEPPVFFAVHRVLRQLRRMSAAQDHAVWDYGWDVALRENELCLTVAGEGDTPVVGEWKFATREAARLLFDTFDSVAVRVAVDGGRVTALLFYVQVAEDGADYWREGVPSQQLSGPMISFNAEFMDR